MCTANLDGYTRSKDLRDHLVQAHEGFILLQYIPAMARQSRRNRGEGRGKHAFWCLSIVEGDEVPAKPRQADRASEAGETSHGQPTEGSGSARSPDNAHTMGRHVAAHLLTLVL